MDVLLKADPKPKEPEKGTERYLVHQIEYLGGRCLKWVSPNVRGVMDRICFLPGGIIFFVEVKAEGVHLEPHQKRRAAELIHLGQRCYRADSKRSVDTIIKGEWHDKKTTESTERISDGCRTTPSEIPTSWLP